MKTIFALLFTCLGLSAYAQTSLNDYKYVVVPKKFEAFKKVNEYQTSTLVKYLFNGKGFNVVYDDALPFDLRANRCLGLMADLLDDSSMFTTKVMVSLTDCNGVEVYKTMQGMSKEKEYKTSYSEAIREAMRSFNGVDYTYAGEDVNNESITVSFKNDVKTVQEPDTKDVEVVKKTQEIVEAKEPVKSVTVKEEATEDTQFYKNNEPVTSTITKVEKEKPAFKKLQPNLSKIKDILYAQTTENGYQLVDSTPKIRMQLLKSSADNVFMAKTDDKNGMVYQKDGKWIFEYYDNNTLIQEELEIKF
ncbi:hypothetical protein [Maribacter sp. MAR_2009_72]|uniref:hypothetical protein n=1 Tax=Maribacter sp. MAR_2009_72 TaxID=1250050 RepID=UPI00119B963D|nr:hypothetical protein [Maribacter sp. MAR_2009_72]TVZ16827.1 hypothetical protein JM81_3099 [Maribacter sp. MAR_2009_72]